MQVKKLVLGLAAAFSLFVHGGTMLLNSGDTLVFMGDSITQFGNENNHGYVRLVMAGLQANDINVTYFGKGVSGQTAVEMKNRFQKDVIANNPKVVTIFAGVNDCSKNEDTGWPNDTTSSPDDVAAMVAMALEENITPVLLSPTSHGGEEFRKDICDYAAAVKKIAEDNHIPYVPTYETFRDYVDDATNPKVNSQYKLTADGTHMSFIGNRMLARLVLRAFGFTDTEMAKAEAAWNLIPRVETLHPSVMITENEYKSIKVAAAAAGRPLSGYLNDLVYHGAELVAQTPARVSATQGATMSLTTTAPITFAQADDLLDCGREMTTHDSMPSVANYALLAAVQALPAVTDADLPSEPVETLDATVFAKQVEFTCSGYTGTSALSGFPVAVRLAAGSPSGFAYSDMNDSTKGDELRFADDEGNSLPYEIDSWDPDGTSLVWVKIPSLTAATSFTMYYGGEPTDAVAARWTWQAGDYVGVWHMSEPSGNVNDSVNGIVGEPTGHAADTMQVASDGVFGKGRVNSTNSNTHSGQSMLLVDDSSLLDFGSVFTFSGWAKMTALPADGLGCLATRHKGGSYAPVWEVRLSDYTTLDVYSGSKTPVSGTIPSAQNAWVHIAGVFDGSTLKAYANGTKVIEQTIDPVQDCDFKMVFGAKEKEWVCGHFVGLFDEFRIREAASSDDWVKAECDQSKTTFLAAGEATDVTGGETHTHTWGEPSYTWTQTTSGYECKATVTCTSVTSHTKSMTVTADYCVVTPATADTDGLGRYTATFTVAPFTSTATNDVVILKTGSGEDEEEEEDPPHDDPEGALASSGDSTGATDVAVIQAAIDAAAPVHGKVTLGSGVFYINAQLMVTNGVTLTGQGWERTVIRQTATPGDDTRVATVKGGATLSQLTVTGGHIDTTANNRFGGGVLLTDGTVSWCCISNNCVSGGNTVYGGGIAIQSSKGRIDHCLIADNVARTSSSSVAGGGIGIYCPSGEITIEACLVRDNRANSTSKHAGNGGGIGIEFSGFRNGVTVRNVTIVGNRAGEVVENDTHVSLGGGLWANPDKSKRFAMTNCIIADNTTVNSGSEVYFTPTDEAYSGGVDYCHFGTVGDLTGDHSTSGDPKFTNASAGDYTLASDSPARGAGTAVAAESKDLTGADFANPPSMGCYEYDGSTPPSPFEPISLGEVVTRPSTNYNGNAVSVAFSGELPDGAAVSAKITIDDTDYAGTVDPESGSLTFAIPDDAATAGNVYAGTITFTVGDDDYSKGVTLTQASVKVVEETDWIKESATMFESTGSWTGDKAEVVSGKISVSNATFTAATPALASSVVTIDTTVVFGDASEYGFETSPRAGVMIVKAGGKDRYAFKTATGAVTNTTVTAKAGMAVNVIMTLDTVANTVAYTVDGTDFGTYAMTAKDDPVSTVRYVGPTEISSLDGAYRFEGLDSNLAKADGVEYATVEEAVAAGNGVELLWDATWTPTAAGDYVFTKHDFVLVIGGSFAYSVKDNGDGTATVSVSGGEEPEPEAASITLAGGVVKVGVTDVSPDCWYALEKTTDLTQDFVVDVKTWTKGDALLAGDGTLSIALGGNEPQAFYRVVVSTIAP